jgi:hypothetical protein
VLLVCLPIQTPTPVSPIHLWVERAENRPENRPFRPGFGGFVGAVGDVDADGTPDLLVADVLPEREVDSGDMPSSDGCAWIFSGRDGRTLARIAEPDARDRGGISTVALGDLDKDGCSDWAVGWGESASGKDGLLDVFSGRTSARLFELRGPRDFARLVANAGDLDGDGRDDLIVSGEPGTIAYGARLALASVLSSAIGKVLSRLAATEALEWLVAPPLSVGPEFTGEGPGVVLLSVTLPDPRARLRLFRLRDQELLRAVVLEGTKNKLPYLASPYCLDRWKTSGPDAEPACLVSQADGTVWSVSMRTGTIEVLRQRDDELEFAGVPMAVAGDIDGDNVSDYWIGTYGEANPDPAVMHAISGADGHTIYGCGRTYEDLCKLDVDPRAGAIAAVGDADHDGVCDVLIGTSYVYGCRSGAAFLVSGKSGKVIFGLTRKADGVSVIRP